MPHLLAIPVSACRATRQSAPALLSELLSARPVERQHLDEVHEARCPSPDDDRRARRHDRQRRAPKPTTSAPKGHLPGARSRPLRLVSWSPPGILRMPACFCRSRWSGRRVRKGRETPSPNLRACARAEIVLPRPRLRGQSDPPLFSGPPSGLVAGEGMTALPCC